MQGCWNVRGNYAMKINPHHSVISEWWGGNYFNTACLKTYRLSLQTWWHNCKWPGKHGQAKRSSWLQEVIDHIIIARFHLHKQKGFILKRADEKRAKTAVSHFPECLRSKKMDLTITVPSVHRWIMRRHSHTVSVRTIFKLTITLWNYKLSNYVIICNTRGRFRKAN